jgi:hypothetical protein
MTVMVDSAAWASKFRFHSQTLLPALNALNPVFSKVKTIQVRILNQPYEPEPTPYKRPELNQENAKGLRILAESVDDVNLQDALTRLAERSKQEDTDS